MPKVRKQRIKFHYSKPYNPESDSIPVPSQALDIGYFPPDEKVALGTVTDSEDKPVTSKKGRREIRRNELLKKLGAVHSRQIEEKNAEKRRKTAVVGDIMPLHNALDEVSRMLSSSSSVSEEQLQKQRMGKIRVVSRNKRRMVLADETKRFQGVLGNQQFKADPLKVISEHLRRSSTKI